MLRDEYLRRLVDESYIEIYLSGMDGARMYWPWRMMPVHETSQRYRNACEKYIVDSAFNKPEITNEDALDAGFRVNAEFVVLADVYNDCNATVESLIDGYDLLEAHTYDGKIIYPLQQPYVDCYTGLVNAGIEPEYIALGGLKDAKPTEQVGAAQRFQESVDDVWVHGLGWGLRNMAGDPNKLVAALHDTPELIDSVDYSTPAHETKTPAHSIDSGEEFSSIQAAEIGTWLIRDLRRVSPYATVKTNQTELEVYQ